MQEIIRVYVHGDPCKHTIEPIFLQNAIQRIMFERSSRKQQCKAVLTGMTAPESSLYISDLVIIKWF
jgi:hypothetical protein